MAEWKKVVVSGSAAELSNLKVDDLTSGNVVIGGGSAGNLTTTAINGSGNIVATTGATGVTMGALTDSHFTGSFTGSFTGDGSALTGVTADFPTTDQKTIGDTDKIYINDGANKFVSASQTRDYVYGDVSGDVTIADGGAATIADDSVTFAKIQNAAANTIVVRDANSAGDLSAKAVTDTQILIGNGAGFTAASLSGDVTMANDGAVTIANNAVETAMLATSLGTLGTNNFTGSFTGSFTGDGSGLTGIATTLGIEGDSGTGTVDLTSQNLDVAGGTNLTSVASGQTITVNLDSTITGDITFSGDTVTVNNDLIVQGTASFQNTENLLVADQFILLNSGSSTTAPGGIVIQQATQDVGETFAWSSDDSRWGVTGSFSADATTFAPDAFVNFVIEGTANDPDAEVVDKYDKKGNMFVGNTGDIWIYV